MGDDEEYLEHTGVGLSLQQVSGGVDRAEEAVPVVCMPARVLGELYSGENLAPIVNCVRERIGMDGVRVIDGRVEVMFGRSELICAKFGSIPDDWDVSLSVRRA